MRQISTLLVAALLLAPHAAFAHTGAGAMHDFAFGFMHPLGGLDHILAMMTAGILAAQLGGRALWLVPASFVAVMAVGGAAGVAGIAIPSIEIGIAASVAVLGAVVALNLRAPVAGAMGLVALFALFHGLVHGAEMPGAAAGLIYGVGFIAATALLHMAGIGLGLIVGRIGERHGAVVIRMAGCAVAVAGVGLLAGIV